jgi:deoxyadenosine/deoxycytidine kinase
MINIILGPSCIGKSYFIEKIIKGSHTYIENTLVGDIWIEDIWSKNVCIHLDHLENFLHKHLDPHGNLLLPSLIKKISELKIPKSVIILGVSYSEYIDRVKKRRHRSRELAFERGYTHIHRPKDYDHLLHLYRWWISELNKNEIPYMLVEAIKDYKVLKEEDFFNMIR